MPDGDNKPNFDLTSVFSEAWDVDARLTQLDLSREKLLSVVSVAITERANATGLHCANAAGTFAYHYGTFALRDKHVSDAWAVDRADGVESICHLKLKIKVAFCNVDLACNVVQLPKPRSEKGAGIERAANGNLFGDQLPHVAPRQKDDHALYYLMLGEDGKAELTRPVVKNGIFVAAIERIFLGHPDDLGAGNDFPESSETASNYDPIVTPKTGT